MSGEKKRKQAPRMRLSEEKRDRFLEVLGQTGNRRAAAIAIGVEPRLMDQRRRFDPVLDRLWTQAVEQADRRLSGASGPFDCVGGRELNVIKRGPDGRLKLQASGSKRWNRRIEDRFFAALAGCGNLSAAARSIGFGISSVYHRRKQWPDFARRIEEALEEAELTIEFRLATWGSDVREPEVDSEGRPSTSLGTNESLPAPPPEKFDPEFGLRFLKWREEKRRGTGKRFGRAPAEPSPEDVTEKILRKVEAIKRHRAARAGEAPGPELEAVAAETSGDES